MVDLDEILMTVEEHMEKAVTYLTHELRGVRTGRASTGLVEFVQVDAYGAMTELRQLALVNVTEATQLAIKPYDPSTATAIVKALQNAGLGLNPIADGKIVRVNIPALTTERRNQLASTIKQMGEQAKVTVRNARRDANKEVDAAVKDKDNHLSEDQAKQSKEEVQDLLKKYETQIEQQVTKKAKEIQEV